MLRSLKRLMRKFLFSRTIAKLLIIPVLKLHNLAYMLSGMYSNILNYGVHPKFHIVKYKNWFLNNIENQWNVLDIGSNTGLLAYALSEKANKVYGIEIIEKLVSNAKKMNPKDNIEYIHADATKYDYKHCEPINCVVLSNVLEHIEHRIEFLIQIKESVKWKEEENKLFLIRVPSIDRDWITLYKKEMGIEWRLDSTHFIEYTMETFTREISESGLKILNIEVKFGEIYSVCKAN